MSGSPAAESIAPIDVGAMLDEVDAEVECATDGDWYAAYGANLSRQARHLFGVDTVWTESQ